MWYRHVCCLFLSASRKFIETKHETIGTIELLATNPRPQVLNMISWLLRIVSCFKWIVLKIHCICEHLYIKHCKNKDKKSTKLKIHKPMSLPFGVLGGALSMYVYMYICIYVYVYVNIFTLIYIYIHTYIHAFMQPENETHRDIDISAWISRRIWHLRSRRSPGSPWPRWQRSAWRASPS